MAHAPSTAAVHRRRRNQTRREKTSVSIRADVLDAARKLVDAGAADNLSAFVESALEEKVRRTRRASLYAAYEAAARDERFMRDMRDIARVFASADRDGL